MSSSSSSSSSSIISTVDIPPSQTLYVNNLPDKVRLGELKKGLYHVFSQFGNVVELIASKTYKMRGQAFIIFDQLASATRAQATMQGFLFFGKNMQVSYAKNKSDIVAKSDGSYVPRPKRKAEGEGKEGQKTRKEREGKKPRPQKQTTTTTTTTTKETSKDAKGDTEDTKETTTKTKSSSSSSDKKDDMSTETSSSSSSHRAPINTFIPPNAAELSIPNRILFVENLPAEANELLLNMLFQQHPGYRESRLIEGRPGISFVEFEDEVGSTSALRALQGFKVTPTNFMRITYAKK